MARSTTGVFGAQPFRGRAGEVPVAQAELGVRKAFIRKVYSLFSLALVLFTFSAYFTAEWFIGKVEAGVTDTIFHKLGGIGSLVLWIGMFFVFTRLAASRWPLNLIALGVYAVLVGGWFGPMLGMVAATVGSGPLLQAGALTAIVFGGLTSYVFISKKDFSFLGGMLMTGAWLLIGIALLSMFGVMNGIGIGYSIAWVVLLAGFMLYDTSNILHRYPANMAASAALAIFLDVVIMFMHLVRIFAGRD